MKETQQHEEQQTLFLRIIINIIFCCKVKPLIWKIYIPDKFSFNNHSISPQMIANSLLLINTEPHTEHNTETQHWSARLTFVFRQEFSF